jgi:hypothetical protein
LKKGFFLPPTPKKHDKFTYAMQARHTGLRQKKFAR